MNSIKNPFILLAFFLIMLFFVPLPETFNAVKVSIAIMIIAYGFSLGAFRKRIKDAKKNNLNHKTAQNHFKNVEKEREKIDENGVQI